MYNRYFFLEVVYSDFPELVPKHNQSSKSTRGGVSRKAAKSYIKGLTKVPLVELSIRRDAARPAVKKTPKRSYADAVRSGVGRGMDMSAVIASQFLCPFDNTSITTKFGDGVTMAKTSVATHYARIIGQAAALVPYTDVPFNGSMLFLLRAKVGDSTSANYAIPQPVPAVSPMAFCHKDGGYDVYPVPQVVAPQPRTAPQFRINYPAPAETLYDQGSGVQPYSVADRTLGCGIRIKILGLPPSQFTANGIVVIGQVEAVEVDDLCSTVSSGDISALMAYVTAGKAASCSAQEVFTSDTGCTAQYLPRGSTALAFSATGSAESQYGGGYGPGGAVAITTTVTAGGTPGTSHLTADGSGAVSGYIVTGGDTTSPGTPPGSTTLFSPGSHDGTGSTISQPTIFLATWGIPPGCQFSVEFVHHVEYVPSSAVAGLLAPTTLLPALGSVATAMTKVAVAASSIWGSTTLPEITKPAHQVHLLPSHETDTWETLESVAHSFEHALGFGSKVTGAASKMLALLDK
jgi:hypothetical protein